MSAKDWRKLESHVRSVASIQYGVPADLIRMDGGVAHDCVLKVSPKHWVIVEITKDHTLDKVRGCVNRLSLTRSIHFTQEHIMCECFIVLEKEPTPAMREAADKSGIEIFSAINFEKRFFDKDKYKALRSNLKFGSAVDVFSGEPDNHPYIEVSYASADGSTHSIGSISGIVSSGRSVVLTGSFGSGKSRCCKELFSRLSDSSDYFCLAIDLRNLGALASANQIIRAHLEELGLDSSGDAVIRLFNNKKVIFLLDGFDEMGGAQWSNDPHKLKEIRYKLLKPIREIAEKSYATFMSGREHFFNSDEEMLVALGLNDKSACLTCQEEFTEIEINDFLERSSAEVRLPSWLPRRPLLCQIILSLLDEEITDEPDANGQALLWKKIIRAIAKREARINDNFEEGVVLDLLVKIARRSRNFANDVEPIKLDDLTWAYKAVRGVDPSDEDAVLLQKLPGLGRISSESPDRRFVDKYILDGLRADDLCSALKTGDDSILSESWVNPLEPLGLLVLADFISENKLIKHSIALSKRVADHGNHIVATDILASFAFSEEREVDFGGLFCDNATIYVLDMSETRYTNFTLKDSLIYNFHMPADVPEGVRLTGCIIDNAYGVPNLSGVPEWVSETEINSFEKMGNVASIKNYKLSEPQRILCVILKKTFFQVGRGRQEDALLRGLGQIDRKGHTDAILRLLIKEGLLIKDKGRHGALYVPVISQKKRAGTLLNLQGQSEDSIWQTVSRLQ